LISNDLLIHEQQLGDALNQCVHSNRKADFSLMLAMLSDDAREFSEFKLPTTPVKEVKTTDEVLRKQFELPQAQRLALSSMEELAHFNQGQHVKSQNLTQLKLEDALSPKPLCFRDDKTHVNTPVSSNTTLYCQQKIKENKEVLVSPLHENVNEWLKNVHNIRVKEALVA